MQKFNISVWLLLPSFYKIFRVFVFSDFHPNVWIWKICQNDLVLTNKPQMRLNQPYCIDEVYPAIYLIQLAKRFVIKCRINKIASNKENHLKATHRWWVYTLHCGWRNPSYIHKPRKTYCRYCQILQSMHQFSHYMYSSALAQGKLQHKTKSTYIIKIWRFHPCTCITSGCMQTGFAWQSGSVNQYNQFSKNFKLSGEVFSSALSLRFTPGVKNIVNYCFIYL